MARSLFIFLGLASLSCASSAAINPQPEKLRSLELKYNCSGPSECTIAGGLKADPVQHFCNFQNPCTIKTTPSYVNWDYIYLDTSNITSITPIQLTVGNGVADLTWGQGMGVRIENSFLLQVGPSLPLAQLFQAWTSLS